jgi:S-adenosylmethionine hydrolase
MTSHIITFTSDFGHSDWFVGVVHGVIHEICPAARVTDLTHEIRPAQIERGAFVLEAAAADFPVGTVHLAVVDPGVGTDRRGLAVRAYGQYFVGPDNGLLEWAFHDQDFEARALVNERYFRLPVSRTFHGRDVFAPVAAHLGCGADLADMGPVVTDPVRLAGSPPVGADGRLIGRVMWIDRFGNALTDVRENAVRSAFPGVPNERIELRINDRRIDGLARAYGDAPVGSLMALMGSSGRVEIAVVGGDVAWRYGIGAGDTVVIREKK